MNKKIKKSENLYSIGSKFEIEFKSLSHPIQITLIHIYLFLFIDL